MLLTITRPEGSRTLPCARVTLRDEVVSLENEAGKVVAMHSTTGTVTFRVADRGGRQVAVWRGAEGGDPVREARYADDWWAA